jgi:hypothetical protein
MKRKQRRTIIAPINSIPNNMIKNIVTYMNEIDKIINHVDNLKNLKNSCSLIEIYHRRKKTFQNKDILEFLSEIENINLNQRGTSFVICNN